MESLPLLPDAIKLRGRDFNALAREQTQSRVISVDGVSTFPSSEGVSLANRRALQVKKYTGPLPWRLYGRIDSGTAKMAVSPGLVNNFIPTISGTLISGFPFPELTVTGTSGIIYLRATVDAAGIITALEILNASTLPADTTTGTLYKHKTIGTWTSASGEFTSVVSILNTNQTFRMCGGNAEWY